MHELYDVKADIPAFSVITDASLHDSKVMERIPYEKDSFYIFDRAYMVTKMLYLIETKEAFFVVREKHKMLFEVIQDKDYNNPKTGVMADQIIKFNGHKTKKQYPRQLRRIVLYADNIALSVPSYHYPGTMRVTLAVPLISLLRYQVPTMRYECCQSMSSFTLSRGNATAQSKDGACESTFSFSATAPQVRYDEMSCIVCR